MMRSATTALSLITLAVIAALTAHEMASHRKTSPFAAIMNPQNEERQNARALLRASFLTQRAAALSSAGLMSGDKLLFERGLNSADAARDLLSSHKPTTSEKLNFWITTLDEVVLGLRELDPKKSTDRKIASTMVTGTVQKLDELSSAFSDEEVALSARLEQPPVVQAVPEPEKPQVLRGMIFGFIFMLGVILWLGRPRKNAPFSSESEPLVAVLEQCRVKMAARGLELRTNLKLSADSLGEQELRVASVVMEMVLKAADGATSPTAIELSISESERFISVNVTGESSSSQLAAIFPKTKSNPTQKAI